MKKTTQLLGLVLHLRGDLGRPAFHGNFRNGYTHGEVMLELRTQSKLLNSFAKALSVNVSSRYVYVNVASLELAWNL